MLCAALLLVALLSFPAAEAAGTTQKPKYGPMASRLPEDNKYVRMNPAPDYWAMNSYYTAQQWGGACSLASLTMVVNGARVHDKLDSETELVTQAKLLEKVKAPLSSGKTWAQAVGAEPSFGKGVSLDELGPLTRLALEAYGVKVQSVEIVHVDKLDGATTAKIHAALVENEKSDRDFIIANFNQQVYTGDSEVGHIAPVGAYDSAKKRVLIFDPDREWYEPYWVSEETFAKGMATKDSAGKNFRGFVWVKLSRNPQ